MYEGKLRIPFSSSASIVPSHPGEVVKDTTKKRKRLIGKGKSKKASICLEASLSSPSVLNTVLSDFAFLYFTLVKDNAVPKDYVQEFLSLEIPARRAAQRSQVSAVLVSDSMAATASSVPRREADQRTTEKSSIGDQLLIAADLKPRKFRTKWQRAVYDGPSARKDADLAERGRWVQLLANLLRSTDTPMGRLIRENPSNVQFLGGGRRAGYASFPGA